jgi:hypothetical protein
MATLAGTNPTLMDVAKLKEPDGGIVTDVVDMLSQDNEIFMDSTWVEANGGTSHRTAVRIGLPEPTWRAYYQGVQPTKGTYAQVDEPLGMMEARSVIDKDLADMETNIQAFRLIEAGGFLEGMNQSLVSTAIYGSVTTSPAKFNGLAGRFSSITGAASGDNIIDAGGTQSDNTSMWIVQWSPRTVFFSYPKGSSAGVSREDLGVNHNAIPPDGSAGVFSAYEEKFTQKAGLVVRDWRSVVRIANIDKSNLVDETSAADILKLLAIGIDKIKKVDGGRIVIYGNRTLKTMLRLQTMSRNNVYLTVGKEEGAPKLEFDGYPIRLLDQLLNTETRVT